jgi:hypothetical protein
MVAMTCGHEALVAQLERAPEQVSYAFGRRVTGSAFEWSPATQAGGGTLVAWCPGGHWVEVTNVGAQRERPAPQSEERAG